MLTYNQNNRLIRVEENSNVLGEYTYNGLGQRMIKSANNVTTVFHYDFDGNIIAESDQDGDFTYEYLYKGSTRLALVDVTSGEMFFFLNDRLGTPLMLTDSTNTVVWEGIYKPFGEAEVNPNSTVVNNFRFPGQYYDEETGFHYNWHRYYDPGIGRYLTADPIGLAGWINLFLYVQNNPVNLIDPEGLWHIDIGISGSAKGKLGPGGTIGFKIGPTGVYFYYGFGLGIGAGVSATINTGDPCEEVSVTGIVRGGVPIWGIPLGGQGSVSIGQKSGVSRSVGVGLGLGSGASLTATHTIKLF